MTTYNNIKSVVVDILSNYGNATNLGIRSIDFYEDSSKITISSSNCTCYVSDRIDSSWPAERTFYTALTKTGSWYPNQWLTGWGEVEHVRLIIVFDSVQDIDEIKINNAHESGANTNAGAKHTTIHFSTDTITDTTPFIVVSNSDLVFGGELDQHSASDAEDEQVISIPDITEGYFCFSPQNMTSNSLPTPFVADASTYSETPSLPPYLAFEPSVGYPYYWITSSGNTTGWVSLDIGSGNAEILSAYGLRMNSIPEPNRAPQDWTIEGSNTGAWTGEEDTLDTVTGETSWGSAEIRQFFCDTATTAYRYFRINITDNNGDASHIQIAELNLYAVISQTFQPIFNNKKRITNHTNLRR